MLGKSMGFNGELKVLRFSSVQNGYKMKAGLQSSGLQRCFRTLKLGA